MSTLRRWMRRAFPWVVPVATASGLTAMWYVWRKYVEDALERAQNEEDKRLLDACVKQAQLRDMMEETTPCVTRKHALSDVSEDFELACMYVRSCNTFTNEQMLTFYALYKQAVVGNCNTECPCTYDIVAVEKWHAWNKVKDLSKYTALETYIKMLDEIAPTWRDAAISMSVSSPKRKCRLPSFSESHDLYFDALDVRWGKSVSVCANMEDDSEASAHTDCSEGDSLCQAVSRNDKNAFLQLLDSGLHIDSRDDHGRTALHWAADRNHLDFIRYIIQYGGHIDVQDVDGQTPFHYACFCAHTDAAILLLKQGADTSILDTEGNTAIDIACEQLRIDLQATKLISTRTS